MQSVKDAKRAIRGRAPGLLRRKAGFSHRRAADQPGPKGAMLEGSIRIFLQDPKEKVELTPGQSFSVPPKRPHLVTNAGETSAVFLVLQGVGEYDFVPLT
jgi:Cupin domain